MATPSQANRIAAAAALLVFLIFLLVVDRTGDFAEPRTTTLVERETVAAPPARTVTGSATFRGGRRTGATRTTELQSAPAQPESSTIRTTETEPLSDVERVLGEEILTFLIALLAALLTAAALQRILLGRYGGSRSSGGSEELDELARSIKLELARIHALIAQLEGGSEAQQHAQRLAGEAFAGQVRADG